MESDEDDEDTDVDSDDEDNPFGDKNAMKTPDPESAAAGGRRGYGFREV
jgi:hypothetical protein